MPQLLVPMEHRYTLSDLSRWAKNSELMPSEFKLAVIGSPIEHSASPQMHNAALEKIGREERYIRLRIEPDELEEAFKLLLAAGFLGWNLTIPHKMAALDLVDQVEPEAAKLGAVNTVIVRNGKLIGANTDGEGIVSALRYEFGFDSRDSRVMMLGTGGAGQAIAKQLALKGCESLILVNRTHEKAVRVEKELRALFPARGDKWVKSIPWTDTMIESGLRDTDLVVNATCSEFHSDAKILTASTLADHADRLCIYDTNYTPWCTKQVTQAQLAGVKAANGAGMLVFQGALSFKEWFGIEPDIEVMVQAVRDAVDK